MIEDWIRTSCTNSHASWKPTTIRWTKKTSTSVKDLAETCRNNAYSCSMSVPSVGVSKKNGGNGIAYHEPFAVSNVVLTSIQRYFDVMDAVFTLCVLSLFFIMNRLL